MNKTYILTIRDITSNTPKVTEKFSSYSEAEAYRAKIEGGCRIHKYNILSVEEIEDRLAERQSVSELNTPHPKRQRFTDDFEYYD